MQKFVPNQFWILYFNFYTYVTISSLSIIEVNSINNKVKSDAYFIETLLNATVPVGRNVVFQCVVNNLHDRQVAWIRKDKHILLALQEKVISQNSRIKVYRNNKAFNLHISDVREEDRGEYMCQVNSEPMISQSGYLQVTVPPVFIPALTSSDTEVSEGDSVILRCAAKGFPIPEVQWRREDKEAINAQSSGLSNKNKKVKVIYGEYLNISRATREDMGAYLCIASNGILPSISKRIFLAVDFAPLVLNPFQRVNTSIGNDVTLSCLFETYPYTDSFWMISSTQQIIVPNSKHKIETEKFENGNLKYNMKLNIKNVQPADFTKYLCIVKNFINQASGQIILEEAIKPSLKKVDPKPTLFVSKNDIKLKKNYTSKPNKPIINQDNLKERVNIASLFTNSYKNNKSFKSITATPQKKPASRSHQTDFGEKKFQINQVNLIIVMIALNIFAINAF